MRLIRGVIIFIFLLVLWQLVVWIGNLPPYILPTPLQVGMAFVSQFGLIAQQSIPTIIETLLGLFFGCLIGVICALFMALVRPVRSWLLPILVVSQAIPTFAIAPLFVVWFGYGMASKIMTTIIMLFFPITSAFYDGLRATNVGWLELSKVMGGSRLRTLIHIQIPAALPSLGTGLRVAATIAPIGAVVGEWVGASQGLGFLMLNANARMQIDLMFASLFAIMFLSLLLYFGVDKLVRHFVTWGTQ